MEQKVQTFGKFSQNDEALVALLKKVEEGDSSALMIFYDATNRLIFGILFRILGDRTTAEEILLDLYTHVWKEAGSYEPKISPLVWLTTTARNMAIARTHSEKREGARQELLGKTESATTVAPEQQQLARSSLESMTSAQRELLESAYYKGISCAEMAAQVGKPIGAVKSHLRIGLSKIAESVRTAAEDAGASDINGGKN